MTSYEEALDDLRASVWKATPGPWTWKVGCGLCNKHIEKNSIVLYPEEECDGIEVYSLSSTANKMYLKHANPWVVGTLLSDLDEVKEQNKLLKECVNHFAKSDWKIAQECLAKLEGKNDKL